MNEPITCHCCGEQFYNPKQCPNCLTLTPLGCQERAEKCLKAIAAVLYDSPDGSEVHQTTLSDFLTDCLHLNLDLDEATDAAQGHYQEETLP